jgi:cytochrome c oxidase assembly protein subunit 15
MPAPRVPTVTPERYRRLTFLALVLVATIIVTGAAVRLSGSGLGCDHWPTCTQHELISVSNPNRAIEQINRLFTGLVGFGVIAAVLGSLWRVPRRRDLVWLSWALVAGVFAQAVIGGIAVLVDLDWIAVAIHFLASMVLLATAVVLHHRAGEKSGPYRAVASDPVRALARVIFVLTAWVLVAGTLVTAAGPHGGDAKAKRLSWSIKTAARLHGTSVMVLLACIIGVIALARRDRAPATVLQGAELLLAAGAIQAGIGYFQYFNGIPPLVVGFHVAGAAIVFAAATHLQLTLREPVAALEPSLDLTDAALLLQPAPRVGA